MGLEAIGFWLNKWECQVQRALGPGCGMAGGYRGAGVGCTVCRQCCCVVPFTARFPQYKSFTEGAAKSKGSV